MCEDKKDSLHIDFIVNKYIYEFTGTPVTEFSDSQNCSYEVGLSQEYSSQDNNINKSSKICNMLKSLIVPCLIYLYPNSALIQCKFQDVKNKFFLKVVDDQRRRERGMLVPEFPDSLKNMLRKTIKLIMERRSSMSKLKLNRLRSNKNFGLEQQKELNVLCNEIVESVVAIPDSFTQVKSSLAIILNLLHKQKNKTEDLPTSYSQPL